MAKVQFNLDSKKYQMEFLPENNAKITQLDNKNKFIIVQYFTNTKVIDFINYIKSLDFSNAKIKHCIH